MKKAVLFILLPIFGFGQEAYSNVWEFAKVGKKVDVCKETTSKNRDEWKKRMQGAGCKIIAQTPNLDKTMATAKCTKFLAMALDGKAECERARNLEIMLTGKGW